jgi:Fur family ferric uptake transcriptional regulator
MTQPARRENPREILRRYIADHGLKSSRQRDLVAEVFFSTGGHLRVEELLEKVRQVNPRVSQATVYRTVRLLRACGLAAARHFSEGETRYESSDTSHHHDHLICTSCGRIVEFLNERIETLQHRVARAHGFKVTAHRLELYGLCASCRGRGRGTAHSPS